MKKTRKNFWALFLTVMLVLSLMPAASVFAEEMLSDTAPKATIRDVIVSGTVGEEISEVAVIIDVQGDRLQGHGSLSDVTSWFDNLPSGLNAVWSVGSETVMNIKIRGTPGTASTDSIQVTIPRKYLASGNALQTTLNPSAKFDIKEAPKATIGDVTVSGTVGEEISEVFVTIRVENDTLQGHGSLSDVTSWFDNLPAGLNAVLPGGSEDEVNIKISGAPGTASTDSIQVTIPGEYLASGNALQTTLNPSAKFDIKEAPKATIGDVIVSGTVGEEISPKSVDIRLEGVSLRDSSLSGNVSDWLNLPGGLSAVVTIPSEVQLVITISGTPKAASSDLIQVTIPGDKLTSGKDLQVTANAKAKYAIKEITANDTSKGTGTSAAGNAGSPQTGDNSNMGLWLGLLLSSLLLAGLAAQQFIRRRSTAARR